MQRYGGISRYFFELTSRLSSNEVADVSIVSPLYINNYLKSEPPYSFVRGRYVPYDFAGVRHMVGLANRFAAPFAWSNMDADIVHETYFTMLPVGKGGRRVVTVYDMIHELFAPKVKRLRMGITKRAAIDRADHIICISETTRRDLIRLYEIDPARTSVVHLGYSLTSASGGAEVQRTKNRPSLLYVGNRGGYKNFRTLLAAFSKSQLLREFELVAFGGPPFAASEHKEIERLGLTGRVRYKSGSDAALAECYRTAVAFVYPSMYEGFGIPPLEAMSHGCPVVCSNAGAIPEVVSDAGVYFDPENAEELCGTLERVAADDGLQTDLRARGYERTTAFSWARCAEDTARIYRKIV
ncbi:hypothetical protein MDUV_28440 [Mycolicibacterium duvalii]|uniref:Glycosyl transferase family 1 n=2 Tax=Mycolicibacterium duvalii TaxID=39688 RepID=A0A7I7K312_9MYCO|nr:hypothetical protein MDUV_28440 [Mycolicibacterium duvalii]